MWSAVWVTICISDLWPSSGPGVAEADENCVKFLEKTMFNAFEKVCVFVYLSFL